MNYSQIYQNWQNDPESFWLTAAKNIDWINPPTKAYFPNEGIYGRWFADATCNTCFNCVDRHIENGKGEQTAIIYDSAMTGEKQHISYNELQAEIIALASVLKKYGIEKGDRVIIYMPMIPQAIIAMLATARLGAVHGVVFGGFASQELATRIDDCTPKLIISASCGLEPNKIIEYKPLLDEALAIAKHKVSHTLILQRRQAQASMQEGRDIDYANAIEEAKKLKEKIDCVALNACDPLYILYTSGTTGQPKGVVRDNGGHMVALYWTMAAIYDIKPGEVYWAASDVGWVVGHSYIVYAPLLHCNTTILFEGKPVGTPDAGTFWRVISEHKVVSLFTAPTAFRAIKREDNKGELVKQYDISCLRSLYLAGERADPDTIHWAESVLGVPVIDHWWQTETGWTIAGNPAGIELLPIKYGSATVAMPGFDVRILDDEGNEVAANTLGNVVVKLPLPPSCLPTLWNGDERFRQAYLEEFKGYYKTSDAGLIDEDGYLFIMARTDDIINVAGHRLSTGAMEEVIAAHKDVAECAVLGIADDLKGQLPAGFIVINKGVERDIEEIRKEIITLVREKIGPVAAFKFVVPVLRLPKTRSGKILRATMQKVVEGKTYKMPATIDDPDILTEIATSWKKYIQ